MSDTKDKPQSGWTRPRNDRNDDPRRQRLLEHMRKMKSEPQDAPPLDPRMLRALANEQMKFEQRQQQQIVPQEEGIDLDRLDPRMRRKLANEQVAFEDRQQPRDNQPQNTQSQDTQPQDAQPQNTPPQNAPPQNLAPSRPDPNRVDARQETGKLTLPDNRRTAIKLIMSGATGALESIRKSYDTMLQVTAVYVDARADLGSHPQEAGRRQDQVIAGIKKVTEACHVELDRLLTLGKQLAAIDVTTQDTPPELATAHQDATQEMQARIAKARENITRAEGLLDKLELDKAGTTPYDTVNDGLPLYKPEPLELPAMLRDFTSRIGELTRNFTSARDELAPRLQQARQLYELSLKKPAALSDSTSEQIDALAHDAKKMSSTFGKWNEPTISTFGGLRDAIAGLQDPKDPETLELWRQIGAPYEALTRVYGEADDAAKNIVVLTDLVRLRLDTDQAKATGSPLERKRLLAKLRETVDMLEQTVPDPILRIDTKTQALAEKKKALPPSTLAQLGPLEASLVELNKDLETVRASQVALQRASQQAQMVDQLLKQFADEKTLRGDVAAVKNISGRVAKLLAAPLVSAGKTRAGYEELLGKLERARAEMGPPATAEETRRLQQGLAALPPAPTKAELFPPKGSDQWKGRIAKGADKKGAELFARVTKAWEGVEKSNDAKAITALEQAALAYINYAAGIKQEDRNNEAENPRLQDPVDISRGKKCDEALQSIRKLRLGAERNSLPPPPWSEQQARDAKRIEACTLVENGAPAKPPKNKGASDSFFIKGGDDKPAFIFKPLQGENVNEGGQAGEGVVREVLSGKFTDMMKSMIGIDFGFNPTEIVRLGSDSFSEVAQDPMEENKSSHETTRMGALQQAVENDGSLFDHGLNDPTYTQNIPPDEVHKIALMDFLTLQLDRSAENVLVQDLGASKRLIPIDGGFAFPSTEMLDNSIIAMGVPPSTEKDGLVKNGQNALLSLPQADQKFSTKMLAAIEKIDPEAVAKGMQGSVEEMGGLAPELQGMVSAENIENLRRSAMFLKKLAPDFTVAEIGSLYATEFKKILHMPAKELEQGLADLLVRGRQRCDVENQTRVYMAEYKQLGGDQELKKLGWTSRMLANDWKRKVEILRNQEAAGQLPPDPDVSLIYRGLDDEGRAKDYEKMGGDRALMKLLSTRKDANSSPKLTPESPMTSKWRRLKGWQVYSDFGGDAAFDRLMQLCESAEYMPYDQLDADEKIAVAVLRGQNAERQPLGTKADYLWEARAFKGG